MSTEKVVLVAVSENAAKKEAIKSGGKVSVKAGVKYLLQVDDSNVSPENVTVKRDGQDLQVLFEGSDKPDLTLKGFFDEGMESQLYGVAEDGQLYAYVRTDGEGFYGSLALADGDNAPIALGGDALGDGAPYLASDFDETAGFVLWPWLLGLAGVGAATAAIVHHNRDNGGHHDKATSAAPTNAKVMDNVGPMQGQLHNGDITDDAHPAISGNGVPGAIIHIFDNGHEIGSTTVAQDGTWSYTPKFTDGGHNIDITQEVPGQKPSAPVDVIDIVIDTTPPKAPTAEVDGTKVDGSETYSNDDKPGIHGDGTPGDTIIVIYPTGETVTTTVDDDGHWVAPKPIEPLPEGDNKIKVIEQDPAGNRTEITVPVIIDTVAPAAPEAHLDPASDSGTKGDGITNVTQPTIDGRTEPGADITVVFPGGEEIHTRADDQGNWSVTPTRPLPEGHNDIVIIATDPAGNQSEPTNLSVVIDSTAPAKPDGWLDPVSDTGVKGDDITSETKPTIDGKTEPGADITVVFPGGEEIHTRADDQGNWSVTPTQPLPEGHNDIVITATDQAGNQSEPTVITVVIDTTAPAKPDAWLDPASDTGVKGDDITSETKPTIDGKTEPGAEVVVIFPTGETITVKADDQGNWHVTPTQPLGEGDNEITVVAKDEAGNQSAPTVINVIIDTTPPDAGKLAITGVYDSVGSLTGNVPNGGETDDARPVISGTGTAGDTIVVYVKDGIGNHAIGSAVVGEDGTWTMKPVLPLATGLNELTAIETDAAGNATDPSAKYSIELIGSVPSAPVIVSVLDDVGPYTGYLQKGAVTDDTQPTFSGTAQAGSLVKLYDGSSLIGSGVANAKGEWTITTRELADGEHNVTATATNTAGMASDPTGIWNFTVDTGAPSNVSNLVVTDDVGDKQGPLHNGDTTDDNQPTFSGDAEPNGKVIIYDNGAKIGEANVGDDGKWSFTPTAALADGAHSFTTEVIDQAGNSSGQGDTLDVIVDTRDVQVSLTKLIDDVGSVTGDIAKGGVTDDTRPEIQGTGKSGSIVTLYDGEARLGTTAVDTNGKWSFTPATALAEGGHSITVTATDAAGNTSSPTAAFDFSVDTTAPAKPTIDQVTDDVGSIQGPVANGGATDDTTPTLSGQAEAGAKVAIYDNGDKLGEVTADKDGKWSYTPTTPISEGQHKFTVDATDKAGNTSVKSDDFVITLDTIAPAKPDAWLDPASDTGVKGDDITSETKPTIDGKTEPGADVTVTFPTGEIITVKADDEGNWHVTPTQPLPEGNNDITVVAKDEAGNASDPNVISVVIDTTPPDVSKLAITGVLDNVGDITGNILDGGSTDDARPVISGTGTAGDTLVIHSKDVNGQDHVLGSATVGADGTWSLKPVLPLISGANELTAVESDAAGNASTSKTYTVILDQGKPEVPVIVSVYDDVGPYTGFLQKGDVTDDKQPTFNGTAQAGSLVKLYDGSTLIGSGVANAKGEWTITTRELADGEHKVTATATNGVGVVSDPTGEWTFSVDTGAPSNVSNLVITDDIGPVQGELHDNDTTDDNRPTFSGDAEPNGKVIIYDNGVKIGEADVDADGKWSFTPTTALADGDHEFATEVLDPAGNSSGKVDQIGVTVDTADLGVQITHVIDKTGSIQGDIAPNGVTDEKRPEIQGTSKPFSIVKITDNGVELGSVTADKDGNWSFKPSSNLSETLHRIEAVATDLAGNVSAPAKFDFTVDLTAPSKPTIDQVVDDVGYIQGPITNGGVTDDSTPTLSGQAEANAKVTIYDNGDKLGEVTADKDGKWSFTPTTPISEGEHKFAVDATDKAGNTSAKSDEFKITTDYSGPTADSTKLVIDVVAGDDIVNKTEAAGTVTISGKVTGEFSKDDIVSFKLDGTTYSAKVSADGSWSVDVPGGKLVADSTHKIDAILVAHDAAGNAGEIKAGHAYSVDTDAPTRPAIDQVYDDVGPIQGPVANGGVTDDKTPTLSGQAEAGSIVTIRDDKDGVLGSTTADKDGKWEFTPAKDLSEGEHSFTVTATDVAGNPSAPSEPFVITTDYTPPVATLTIESVGANDIISAVDLAGTVSISGTSTGARAGDLVTLTINGKAYSTAVDASGKWTVTGVAGSDLLADSDHKVDGKLHATDVAGNFSDVSAAPHAYTLLLTPTAIATTTYMDKESGASQTDWLTNNGAAGRLISGTITGTLGAGEKVQVSTDGGVTWQDAYVSGAQWDAMDANSHSGSWDIQSRVVSGDGVTVGAVSSKAVTLDNVAPNNVTNVTFTGTQMTVKLADTTLKAGDVMDIRQGGMHVQHVLSAAEITAQSVTLATPDGMGPGLSVSLIDQAGNISLAYNTAPTTFISFDNVGTPVSKGSWLIPATDVTVISTGTLTIANYSPSYGSDGNSLWIRQQPYVTFDLGVPREQVSFTFGANNDPNAKVVFYDAAGQVLGTVMMPLLDSVTNYVDFTASGKVIAKFTLFAPNDLNGGIFDNLAFDAQAATITEQPLVQTVVSGSTDCYGGSGDNVFNVANATDLSGVGVHGNGGIDTLKLTGAGQTLTLSTLISAGKLDGVEVLDITGSGDNVLNVRIGDLLHLGEKNAFVNDGYVQLMVKGDAGDRVNLSDLLPDSVDPGTWAKDHSQTIEGVAYDVYRFTTTSGTAFNTAELLVQQGVSVTIKNGVASTRMLLATDDSVVGAEHLVSDGAANPLAGDHVNGVITGVSIDSSQSLPFALPTTSHVVAGMADTYYGADQASVVTPQYAAGQYLASGENQGAHGGEGGGVLKLAGYDQLLDLATSQGKLTGMEVIDLVGQGHNTLTLSLKDVLENGQTDLFYSTDKHSTQMLVQGDASDIVNLSHLQGKGGTEGGSWTDKGAVMVDGTSYGVYQHSSFDAELLVQQAVKVNLV